MNQLSRPMIPVLDAKQAAAWDEHARKSGRPSRVLMESAGRAAANILVRHFGAQLENGVLVAAGHGNNGGDGWVIARALHAVGMPTWVAEYEKARTPDCDANRTLALQDGVVSLADNRWPPVDVTVDAILGTGATGAPRKEAGELAARVMESGAKVVAVDGPTGLDLTTGEAFGPVRADLTVTFGGLRRGHLLAREICGRIRVVDIGFGRPPPDANWPHFVDDQWAVTALPRVGTSAHKGSRGRILVVGGEDGMAGAAVYSARAAFAAGAGLVRIAAQAGTVAALQQDFPDSTVIETSLEGAIDESLGAALDWADCVVLGPGLGRGDGRAAFVAEVLSRVKVPIILDADALHVGIERLRLGEGPRVLTPHLGEFTSAFPGIDVDRDRFAAVSEAAEVLGIENATVLLKGVPTVVSDGTVTRAVGSGNPGLATGGSGDVLSGLIGAFAARGLSPMDAACLGAHALGRSAEHVSGRMNIRAMRPSDVIEGLSSVWDAWKESVFHEPPNLLDLPAPAVG